MEIKKKKDGSRLIREGDETDDRLTHGSHVQILRLNYWPNMSMIWLFFSYIISKRRGSTMSKN
jgi:hypothetical protein